MTQLNKQDIEMLGKIADIIKDSDFEIKNVTFRETCAEKPNTYKTSLDFELHRKEQKDLKEILE